MRETRLSGLEGGATFYPSFLPLSAASIQVNLDWLLRPIRARKF